MRDNAPLDRFLSVDFAWTRTKRREFKQAWHEPKPKGHQTGYSPELPSKEDTPILGGQNLEISLPRIAQGVLCLFASFPS